MLKLLIFTVLLIFASEVNSGRIVREAPDTQSTFEILAKKFEEWSDNLKMETDELKDRPFIKELRESLSKTMEEFMSKIPSEMFNVNDYAEKAKKVTEDIIGQLKSPPPSEEATRFKEFSAKLFDDAKNKFNSFRKNSK